MTVGTWHVVPRLAGATLAAAGLVVAARVPRKHASRTEVVRCPTREELSHSAPSVSERTSGSFYNASSSAPSLISWKLLHWARQQQAVIVACVVSVSLTALAGAYPLATSLQLGPAAVAPVVLAPVSAALLSLTVAWFRKVQSFLTQHVLQLVCALQTAVWWLPVTKQIALLVVVQNTGLAGHANRRSTQLTSCRHFPAHFLLACLPLGVNMIGLSCRSCVCPLHLASDP
jgi:hypothetical protein